MDHRVSPRRTARSARRARRPGDDEEMDYTRERAPGVVFSDVKDVKKAA
ncbi:MAG: hypothetical protein K2P86_05270 [Xanthobacteraceae bacterium]|jgi:hypothetical protein|nr:hypothetical protein [Xanthobacteraceae bacterium]